ncbi:glycosyltransferase [Anabaena cylindrica UHCC 0172]|uniref:glycosyltransferase n=1 Tax=Anabaena cylindrica TaxID=1165 RepID=UPI002B20D08D|nr:glycosyltransferase [Anabaena cylindrica]MEA5550926.1 glycosyltransferase [Anabaena cylindrica UHCC 0172]
MRYEQLANFNGKVYFFCLPREEDEGRDQFQHLFICLAEGFRELGISFFSNINYWQELPEKQEYLFRHDPDITPDDCSVVVFSNNWFNNNYPLPDNLFHANRKYLTVYLDGNDNDKDYNKLPEYRQFDFIFKTHYNRHLNYLDNFYPWSFGLSQRILQELSAVPNFQDRNKQILVNFRHWRTGHPVRNISSHLLMPQISNIWQINNSVDNQANFSTEAYHHLHWLQTGKRHYPTYYNRLKNSTACACFGGFFVPAWLKNSGGLINRNIQRLMTKLRLKSNTIVQWDSWRFWESLAAGCVTFHVDFEKYGIFLPVMPVNWQHYIGIDLDNVQAAIDRIVDEPEILEKIALQGRSWALQHYSPVPTALRFLETVYQQPITKKVEVETLIEI